MQAGRPRRAKGGASWSLLPPNPYIFARACAKQGWSTGGTPELPPFLRLVARSPRPGPRLARPVVQGLALGSGRLRFRRRPGTSKTVRARTFLGLLTQRRWPPEVRANRRSSEIRASQRLGAGATTHRPSRWRERSRLTTIERAAAAPCGGFRFVFTASFAASEDKQEGADEDARRRRLGSREAALDRDDRARRTEGGRGPRRDHGDRHMSHRRLHAVGGRLGGEVPVDPRPRGCRHRARDRSRRDDGEGRRARHPALHAGMPPVQNLPVTALEPL